MPDYPKYRDEWFRGELPSMWRIGPPPDLLPTSNVNPAYDAYASVRGRWLAGLGDDDMKDLVVRSEAEHTVYPNELALLGELDDVQGTGIFDPSGTHGNVHADAGIFADRWAMPGYLQREHFLQPSEVIDITTGKPVMYTPSNGPSLALMPSEQWALVQTGIVRSQLDEQMRRNLPETAPMREIVDAPTPVYRVALGEEKPEKESATAGELFVAAGIAGLAIGLVAGMMAPRRKRK